MLSALPHDEAIWARPVTTIPGIGPARAERLAVLGVRTWADLLLHVPRHYRVFHACEGFERIDTLTEGSGVLVAGEIIAATVRRSQQRPHLVIESFRLRNGKKHLPIHLLRPVRGWHTPQPSVNVGERVSVRAILKWRNHVPSLAQPEFIAEELPPQDEVIPIYPLTQGVTQNLLRNSIRYVLQNVPSISVSFPGSTDGSDVRRAFRYIHQPATAQEPENGRRRLAWLEIALLPPPTWQSPATPQSDTMREGVLPTKSLCHRFVRSLPFQPTKAQTRVMREWDAEMHQPVGTRRLLTGDVGSGKTMIIAYALLKTVEQGAQGALIAPTRLLATQHAQSLARLFRDLDVTLELLTGSTPADDRERIIAGLQRGETDIVVGTQALIQEHVRFRHLGLGVIDEQHRFGVAQREALESRGAERILVVSATPIPRTMAQTVYRGLPISCLDERPAGRRPVETRWVPSGRRDEVLRFLKRRAEAGEQGFVVCPHIESEFLEGGLGAEEMFAHLQQLVGKGKVLLIHGQMSAERQARAMTAFAAGDVPILVATSIVEVGVDVPKATVMIIEAAHLFGLAQLHQLRGRVGRGDAQAYAILISDGPTQASRHRLDAIRRSTDGFYLAEQDLELRGPGEFSGARQWGMSDLRFVDLARDLDLFDFVNGWREKGNQNFDALIQSLPQGLISRLRRLEHQDGIDD